MPPSPICASCALIPINLHRASEARELVRQRVLCGWNYDDETIAQWRAEIDAGTKGFFWIVLPARDAHVKRAGSAADGKEDDDDDDDGGDGGDGTSPGRHHRDSASVRVGHISLDSSVTPADLEVANPDKSVLTITSFFVLEEFRALGVGRAAMDHAERLAKEAPFGAPHCRAIAVHTVSKVYAYDEEERERWIGQEFVGMVPERGRTNQEWYEKRGYVEWKRRPMYPTRQKDGTEWTIVASFLKKYI